MNLAYRTLAELYRNRAAAYFIAGKPNEALLDADKAIEMDPKDSIAFQNRAGAKETLGDIAGSMADLKHAVELDPNNADAAKSLERLVRTAPKS